MGEHEKCRCGGQMTVGFIPDHADMASVWVSVFVEGTAKARASKWEKFFRGHGVQPWSNEEVWALSALRCADCGRVELYAKDHPDPELHRTPLAK